MNIVTIGAGYVGLTTASCLAGLGHWVTCLEAEPEKLALLQAGEVPIYEPGLTELIQSCRLEGRLQFDAPSSPALGHADVAFIAVGTPEDEDGDIDLSFVMSAAEQIAPHLRPGAVVAIKSTVVAGTARAVSELIARQRGARDVHVVSNPEFLREGRALADFLRGDRVVVGADDDHARAVMAEVYAPLHEQGVPIILTGTNNAELIKYAANACLALRIGFVNELADLCEAAGGDISEVVRGVGLDRRIGNAFLQAGPGFGGSCFPKDTRAFTATGRRLGARQSIVEALIEANEARKEKLAQRILSTMELERGRGRLRAAVLGVAFKAGTDDVRNAASLSIVPQLLAAGVEVVLHDPKARRQAEPLLPGALWAGDPYEAAQGAHATIVLAEWTEYQEIDLRRLRRRMAGRLLFDFRNLYCSRAAAEAGLRCIGIGRSEARGASGEHVLPMARAGRLPIAPPRRAAQRSGVASSSH